MGNLNSGRSIWVWTPERVALLTELWNARDLTAVLIGERMGLTKDAVIGKARRLDLMVRRGSATRQPFVDKPKPPRPPRQPRAVVVRLHAAPERPEGNAWEPLPGTVPVSLIDLHDGQCKWPIGQGAPFLFCGVNAADGKPYCTHHLTWSVGLGTIDERRALRDLRRAA